jgi:glycosyltransferase involved in cell wall biosynthesis
MISGKRIAVVIAAYNAEKTLERVWHELPHDILDDIILVDDASSDNTVLIAERLAIAHVIKHDNNQGYGANQKTCYAKALELGADVIVLLHADYQYTPRLVRAMASMVADGVYPVVLASRMLGASARSGGMPLHKYLMNKVLTLVQNLVTGANLSEYHTGFRAYSRDVLMQIGISRNDDGFIFDNQIILQILYKGYRIGEVACPTRYASDSSVIRMWPGIVYSLQVLWLSLRFLLAKMHLLQFATLDFPVHEKNPL